MSDYKETRLKAKQRANYVSITNTFGEVATIQFIEEVVTLDGDQVISRVPMGQVAGNLEDPGVLFPLLDPETNEVIGDATFQDTYNNLYSLYRFLADRRDAALQPPSQ
jgi:hypothetical protein